MSKGQFNSTRINLSSNELNSCTYSEVKFNILGLDDKVSSAAQEFLHTLDRQTRNRLSNSGPQPQYDTLTFPVPAQKPYYMPCNNSKYRQFMVSLYNLGCKYGYPEPRLLIAPHLPSPYTTEFLPNPELSLSDFVLPSLKVVNQLFVALKSYKPTYHILAKKTSTPGFPWLTSSGESFSVKDVNIIFKNATLSQGYYKKDYSGIKKGYKKQILAANAYLMEQNGLPSSKDVGRLMAEMKFPVICSGYRTNNIPTPINIPPKPISNPDSIRVISKDRRFSYPVSPRQAITGFIDNKKLSDLFLSKTGQNFGVHRKRVINIMNYVPSIGRHVVSQTLLSGIEKSQHGFLSTSDVVKDAYSLFLGEAHRRNYECLFFTGDRSDNDAFITANLKTLLNTFPDNWRRYFESTLWACRVTYGYAHVIQGLLSGIPETTLLNVLGTLILLYPRFFKEVFQVNPDDFIKSYVDKIVQDKPFMDFGNYIVFLPLPTDNTPLIIAGPGELIKEKKALIDGSWGQKMSRRFYGCKTSTSSMVEFGCFVDASGITEAPTSVLSKLFFFESAGFYEQDCFKVNTRLSMLPEDFRVAIDTLYKTTFGLSLKYYDAPAQKFLRILRETGLAASEFINQYNPAEHLMLSKYVDPNFQKTESTLDPSYYQEVIDFAQKL